MPAERLVPFATPPAEVAAFVARQEANASANAARGVASISGGLAAFAFVAGGAAAVVARLLEWIGHWDPENMLSRLIPQSIDLISSQVLLWLAVALAASIFPLTAVALHRWLRSRRLTAAGIDVIRFNAEQPLITCHRRYVVPHRDLDQESRRVWDRAVHAVAEVRSTQTFATGRVSTVEYVTALPNRLWSIASGLASLTSAKADDARIVEAPDWDRPELSPTLGQRRQWEEGALQGVLHLVDELEEYAALLQDVDDKTRLAQTAHLLSEPSEHHLDLLARQLPADDALGPDGQLTLEADAIRRQAAEAIHRANEAGRAFLRPQDRPQP